MGASNTRPTIMIVDDSADLRELVALQLRFSGYDVVEARDGHEAVELAREKCPALVFMDIQMPVMDGVTATRMIRQIEELCGVVIVAFSAFASGDNRQSALEAGCDEYVIKDESINFLSRIAGRYLSAT